MFKDVVSRRMAERGVTIGSLARLTGLNRDSIGLILRGKSANPRYDTVRKIAIALELSGDQVFEFDGKSTNGE